LFELRFLSDICFLNKPLVVGVSFQAPQKEEVSDAPSVRNEED
jgi:hypothetical protein